MLLNLKKQLILAILDSGILAAILFLSTLTTYGYPPSSEQLYFLSLSTAIFFLINVYSRLRGALKSNQGKSHGSNNPSSNCLLTIV